MKLLERRLRTGQVNSTILVERDISSGIKDNYTVGEPTAFYSAKLNNYTVKVRLFVDQWRNNNNCLG